MNNRNVNALVLTAMFAALSTVAYFFIEIPITDHLKLNFSDVASIIAGILIGLPAAIAATAIRCMIHLMRTSTFGIGEIVDFCVAIGMFLGFYVIPPKLLKKKKIDVELDESISNKEENNLRDTSEARAYRERTEFFCSIKNFTFASVIGIIFTVLFGLILNCIFYPIFMSLIGVRIESSEVFIAYLISTIPINVARGAINFFGAAVIYLPLKKEFDKLLRTQSS